MTPHPIDLLVRYASGDVDARERALVDDHVAGCAECARDLVTIAQMHSTLAALPPRHAANDFNQRLMARVTIASRPRWMRPVWLAAAAVLLVTMSAAATAAIVRRQLIVTAPPGTVAPADGNRAYMLIFMEDMRWRQALPEPRRRDRGLAFSAWIRTLDEAGHLLRGGRVLPPEGGRIVATGAEVTRQDGTLPDGEIVSGYILISAADYDEATRLTMGCPIVTEGKGRVVIRQMNR